MKSLLITGITFISVIALLMVLGGKIMPDTTPVVHIITKTSPAITQTYQESLASMYCHAAIVRDNKSSDVVTRREVAKWCEGR